MKTALISVSNKNGLAKLSEKLLDRGVKIYASGGTYTYIKNVLGLSAMEDCLTRIEDLTGFPEILGGRVKTLHPRVYGGILSDRTERHTKELEKFKIPNINYVIVNLYPFKSVNTIENIDIGGVSLIRAAAKNHRNVTVITNPEDYHLIYEYEVGPEQKKNLAIKAFKLTSEYDKSISEYFMNGTPQVIPLKYGLNPYQTDASVYQNEHSSPLSVLNGSPGYINILDALLGWQLVKELSEVTELCVAASYKHNSPAGVGTSAFPLSENNRKAYQIQKDTELTPLAQAYVRARNGDPLSSFGDFVALSHEVDECTAKQLKKEVSDGVIAPSYSIEALEILKTKKNGNFVILQIKKNYDPGDTRETRTIFGVELNQIRNTKKIEPQMFSEWDYMQELNAVIANVTLKYTQSNSIVCACDGQVVGVGSGQQNRVDCIKIACEKMCVWEQRFRAFNIKYLEELSGKRQEKVNKVIEKIKNDKSHINNLSKSYPYNSVLAPYSTVMASDAFFPHVDNIELANRYEIKYITQPGGSIIDSSVDAKCEEYGIKYIKTSIRLFTH